MVGGALVCPLDTLGPSTLGAQGAPCPESHGKGRLTHWAAQTGRTLFPCQAPLPLASTTPKTAGGSSVPCNHTVSTTRAKRHASLPLLCLDPFSPPATAKPTPTRNPQPNPLES